MSSFYHQSELSKLGLKRYGKNVLISKKASIYSPENIVLSDDVRIDDFSILSGKITVGNNVHISAGSKLYGGSAGIVMQDYSGCSANCTIYAETDDFSGEYAVGSMAPEHLRHVINGEVVLGKYAQLGANTVVLPGVIIHEGAVTGSLTLVKSDLESWSINVGIPSRKLKERSQKVKTMLLQPNE